MLHMTQPSPSSPRGTPDIAAVDAALRPLWPALDEALATRCPVLVLTNWHPLPEAALLPFHVSLRWPDHFDPLPLNWTGALVPCAGPDRRMLERTLYRIEDVFQARVIARGWRDLAKINQDCDFELEAW